MKSIEELVVVVRSTFGKSRPDGILLAWDRDRFYLSLLKLCPDCKVVNSTDFNYSYCNSFEFELNVNVRDDIDVVTFKTSFIADAFSVHVTRYSKDRKHGRVVGEPECTELMPTLASIRRFANERDLQEIDGPTQGLVIDGLSLELSEPATLGKCLFDDFE